MLLRVCLTFMMLIGLGGITAQASTLNSDDNKITVVTMTHEQTLTFAQELVEKNKLEDAKKVLLLKPFQQKELEIERLYLLAQIATKENKIDKAIDIYYFILEHQPNISNIRFRLAELYLIRKDWIRADYHYRLALADRELPIVIQNRIKQALYYIRQNKNYNFWFNFGIAPDNNVNNTTSGEQCVMTMFGPMCNTLDDPEKDIGLNIMVGGNYEFKLSDNWRFRNEALIYSLKYQDKKYDDIYLSYVLGLKYVYKKGDVFFGPTFSKRFLGHKSYNYTTGFMVDTGYDLTKQLNARLYLSYTPTHYDDYGDILDGDVKTARLRMFYALDSSKYLIFKTGYEYEKTKDKTYTNDRVNLALGFGADIPFGFHIYAEPSVLFTNYKGKRWTVKDYEFKEVKEWDITQRYSVSLSNRKISLWGLMPVLTYSYTDKKSNIWQREYQKSLIELSIQKRF
ncbi:MAG: DUF560 domain-containing protein [Alphaproteobacteria bacterium]|nr:DUF560 domain-containing protein [Alphaproteobacteria bacterium]